MQFRQHLERFHTSIFSSRPADSITGLISNLLYLNLSFEKFARVSFTPFSIN